MAISLSYQNLSNEKLPIYFQRRVNKILKNIIKITGKKIDQLSIVFVSPQRIRQLNRIYRRQDKVTDVLSFIYKKTSPIWGEIVICLPQAKLQAQKWGSNFLDELDFLLVHGCLHLLGYDHKKFKDEKKMTTTTYKILGKNRLGYTIYVK